MIFDKTIKFENVVVEQIQRIFKLYDVTVKNLFMKK
jgi:hypothetical protein